MRDAIVGQVSGVDHCADITAEHLTRVTKLEFASILNGLNSCETRGLCGPHRAPDPGLKPKSQYFPALPAGIFDDLTALRILWLNTP